MTALIFVIAWTLCVVCIARAEHVIASDVWIAIRGEEFKKFEKEQVARHTLTRQSSGTSTAWKEVGLTPEQRWALYRRTGGGQLPWLFFGVRSHRLLVAARRQAGGQKALLIAARIAWLNWCFPVWMGGLLLVLASNHFGGGTAVGIALAAGFLTLNTCATLIGGAFSAITMKGFTRHHDSAQVSPESRNNAITEVGYALAAALLVVFTAAVAVQTLGQADTEVSFKSFVASIDFVISGEMNNLITLNSDWVPFLRLVAHVVMIGVGFVFLSISLASAKNMWMKSED